jgi:endo-1,4-beta-xylanase
MNAFRRSAFSSIATVCLASVIGCAEGVEPQHGSGAATGVGGSSAGGSIGTGLTGNLGTGVVTGNGGSPTGTGGGGTSAGGSPGTSGAGGTNPSNGGAASTGGQQAVDAGPPAIGVVVAQYEASGSPTDNNIVVHVRLENRSTRTIPVAALTIRYWYTVDAAAPSTTDYQVIELNYADITRLNKDTHVKFSFGKMAKAETGADHFVEVGFDGPYAMAPGGVAHAESSSTNQIEFRTHWNDWKNYNEADDYSYDATKTSWADSNKVTVYQNGVLIWGTEPDGTTPTPTTDGGAGSDAAVPTDGATDGASPPADAARG